MAQPSGLSSGNTLSRIGNALQGNPSGLPTSPIGKIGFLLQQFSAGAQGRATPLEIIRQQQIQDRQLNLQQFRTTLAAIREGVEMFSGLDPDDPETQEAINRFTGQFGPLLGEGFTDSFNAGLELERTRGREALEGLVEHQERIFGICGLDRDCIQSVAGNASLMAQFAETADQERLPAIIEKLEAIGEMVGEEAVAGLADGFTLADIQSLDVFTPEEIRTIGRSAEVQEALIPLGFQSSDLEKLRREREIIESTAARFRGGDVPSLRFTNVTEGGKTVSVGQDPRTGEVVSRNVLGDADDVPVNLQFREVEIEGSKFLLGLNPNTGEFDAVHSLGGAALPAPIVKEIEEDGVKFIVGLNDDGSERFRMESGKVDDVPAETRTLQSLLEIQRQASADGDEELAGIMGDAIARRTAIVGRTPEDIAAAEETRETRASNEAIRTATENLAELNVAMDSLARVGPEAVGVSGSVISSIGGFLEQGANLIGADGEWLPTREVQQVRSELAALFGRYIPTITAEEGGRYTEGDVARARLAAPLVESPASSFGQVTTALETLRDIEVRVRARAMMRRDGVPPEVDITYPSGQLEHALRIRDEEGITLEAATERVIEMMDRYGIPITVRGVQEDG